MFLICVGNDLTDTPCFVCLLFILIIFNLFNGFKYFLFSSMPANDERIIFNWLICSGLVNNHHVSRLGSFPAWWTWCVVNRHLVRPRFRYDALAPFSFADGSGSTPNQTMGWKRTHYRSCGHLHMFCSWLSWVPPHDVHHRYLPMINHHEPSVTALNH